jgi:hypothetical protein
MALPLIIPIVAGAAAAAGVGGASATDIGRNTRNPQNFGDSPHYNKHRFYYGGYAGGADEASNRYKRWGEAAQDRQAAQADYSQSNWDRQQAGYARADEGNALRMMRDRASGAVPSIAQMQADRQMQQAAAEQSSAAASARGPAALAMAQQMAAANTATAQGNISGQAQIAAAQERLAAEQAYGGLAGQMRSGDLQAGGMAAQQAQFQAQLQQQQRGQNDAFTTAMFGNEMGVNQQQLHANLEQQRMMSGSQSQGQALEMQAAQNNAARDMQMLGMVTGALTGGAGGAAGAMGTPNPKSDVRAKQNAYPLMSDREAKRDARELGQAEGLMAGMRASLEHGPADGTRAALARSGGVDIGAEKTQAAMASIGGGSMQARQDQMTSALGALHPYSYEYKPGMGPPGPNVGPMAQEMAANPITATAVQRDPESGLLALDRDRSLKLALGGVGHLAQKQQMTEAEAAAANAKADAMLAQMQGGLYAAPAVRRYQ